MAENCHLKKNSYRHGLELPFEKKNSYLHGRELPFERKFISAWPRTAIRKKWVRIVRTCVYVETGDLYVTWTSHDMIHTVAW